MAQTESTMMALGSLAPGFSLKATSGDEVKLSDFDNEPALVVLFICNHCPYVIHISAALKAVSDKYMPKGVGFVAINSNDAEAFPSDNFQNMQKEVEKRGYSFPYLFDDDQSVARAYGAACTPDLYVFDAQRRLVYRGQFDDTRPHRISSGNYDSSHSPATGEALAITLDLLLSGDQIPDKQYPSLGCGIKWKPDTKPAG